MTGKTAGIILSTYNGEKYILQLLDSLYGQTYQDICVYIRDDGSTDKTVDLIRSYDKEMNIFFEAGEHVGVVESFFELLLRISGNRAIEYICFCDQDDIWENDKVKRAVNSIQGVYGENCGKDVPILYFSDYNIVNTDLGFIKTIGIAGDSGRICFENALVQNIVPGFTCVINRQAGIMISGNLPCAKKIVMHDWWTYLVVAAFGRIVYDRAPTVYYRRHGKNTMDANTSAIGFWKNRLKRFFNNKGYVDSVSAQVEEFIRCFGSVLDYKKKNVVKEFLDAADGDFCTKLRYVFNGKACYQAWIDNFLFKLILLFEKPLKQNRNKGHL